MSIDHGIQPLAGCGSIAVRQQLCAVQNLGLALVVGRHGQSPLGEALVERRHRVRVFVQLNAQRLGHTLPGQVVLGGTKTSRKNDDIGAPQRNPDGLGQMLWVVADDGLKRNRDTKVIQAGGQIKGVGVLTKGRQHLRADSDNFSDHVSCWMRLRVNDSDRLSAIRVLLRRRMARFHASGRPLIPSSTV